MARQRTNKPIALGISRDTPPTPSELAAIEVLRQRDGITRAAAMSRVLAMKPEDVAALLPKKPDPVAPIVVETQESPEVKPVEVREVKLEPKQHAWKKSIK